MGIYRRPVSARRNIKGRKTRMYKKTYTPPRISARGGPVTTGMITGLSRNNFGFPDTLRTKLVYADVVQLTASAGSPGIWQFRLASLFDPDFTGTGHQPQWFDQLSAVYQRYRVIGAKISITYALNTVADTEANDRGPYIIGLTTSQSASFGSANYPALLEDPNSQNAVLCDKQGANNVKTLTATFSPKRDLGTNADDVAFDLTTGNPTIAYYATAWALDMTELANQDVAAKVHIEYIAEFRDIRMNTVS